MKIENCKLKIGLALAALFAAPLRAEEMIRISLDKPGDSHVKPFIDRTGFAVEVQAEGNLQKLEPTIIRIETQQKGK